MSDKQTEDVRGLVVGIGHFTIVVTRRRRRERHNRRKENSEVPFRNLGNTIGIRKGNVWGKGNSVKVITKKTQV